MTCYTLRDVVLDIMKLWLDDIRTPPDSDWVWAKTADDAIYLIRTQEVDEISFDHDLGISTDGTGYSVAMEIEFLCHEKKMKCPKWKVHSANPVGVSNIIMAMKNAEKYSI